MVIISYNNSVITYDFGCHRAHTAIAVIFHIFICRLVESVAKVLNKKQ